MLNAFRAGQMMKPITIRIGEILRLRPASIASCEIENFKLYGERNTGTRFLGELLHNNFATQGLRGSNKSEDAKHERADLRRRVAEQRQLVRLIVEDKRLSLQYPEHIAKSFGWKHASPPIEFLKSVPDRAARTLFIVVVKHPVYWALSFHKRPYHTYFPATKALSFQEFLHHIFIPSGRDNVGAPVYASAIELYAAKVDGYRRLAELGVPFELIRYEEMLRDIPGVLEQLAAKYKLGRRHADWIVRSDSTKERNVSIEDYREKYRLDRARDIVPPEEYDFIMKTFGAGRLAWLGYR